MKPLATLTVVVAAALSLAGGALAEAMIVKPHEAMIVKPGDVYVVKPGDAFGVKPGNAAWTGLRAKTSSWNRFRISASAYWD